MFEAKLGRADQLKKILDAIAMLVTDANFDVDEDGLKLQAMDNSHVALTSLELKAAAFSDYRCDRNLSLGMNIASLQKMIKCAGNADEVTLRADNNVDVLDLVFQDTKSDRMGEYSMKLMDIDQEHLGIPDTAYDAEIELSSTEFARIVRDLKDLGESVKIEVTKEGVKFSAEGDIGTAAVTLRPTEGGSSRRAVKNDDDEMDEDVKPEVNGDDDDDDAEAPQSEDDGDAADKGGDDEEDEEKPEVVEDDDEDTGPKKNKKRKATESPKKKPAPKKKTAAKAKGAAKGKGKKKDDDDDEARKVAIHLTQSVALTFSIKYLQHFSKSAPLATYVRLNMSNEVPLLVEYRFDGGSVKFYLAPKISDE